MRKYEEKRLVFIVNPSAKNGVSKKIWNKLNYKAGYIPYEVFYTKHQKTNAQDLAVFYCSINI